MLTFNPNDNAVFCGVEAEGVNKGLPTLFIVGSPSVDAMEHAFKTFIEKIPGNFGLYIGAGGSLVVPSFELLNDYAIVIQEYLNKRERALAFVVTIEATPKSMDEVKAIEELFLAETVHWVIPYYWKDENRWIHATDAVISLAKEMEKDTFINIFLKIYVYNQVLMITPLIHCTFADYDNNKDEYREDKLLYIKN